MSDLDERLAKIRSQRSAARTTAGGDLARLMEDLAKAQIKFKELDTAQQNLAEAIESESHRIAALRRRVTAGVVLILVVVALTLALTGLFTSRMVDTARTEAATIRTENAQRIAAARAEGEASLQALSERMRCRRPLFLLRSR